MSKPRHCSQCPRSLNNRHDDYYQLGRDLYCLECGYTYLQRTCKEQGHMYYDKAIEAKIAALRNPPLEQLTFVVRRKTA